MYDYLTDGLMRLTPTHIEEPWVATNAAFFVGDSALFPHPFLARYRELLGVLAELAEDPASTVYVAIDPHRIGRRDELQCRLLEDYWDRRRSTRSTGTIRGLHSTPRSDVARPRNSCTRCSELGFTGKARADHESDPVKRVYIQELKPSEDRSGDPFEAVLNRELHAERDTSTRKFMYVDGKIVHYPTETYAPTATNPRALPGPHERKRKLWRVDGPMSDEQWMEVAGLFFRDNELIGEHFEDAFAERV